METSGDDAYDHPDGVNCVYIPSSIYGSDEVYAVKCECIGDHPCREQSCPCVKSCGVSYVDGKLVEEKLVNSNSSIFECNERCSCGVSCRNKVSQMGPCKDLRIVDMNSKGYGVVADVDIPRGSFLCEYAGELSSSKPQNADWRYVITLTETSHDGSTTETFIDASHFGNVGRYLNHSCDPNAVLVPIRYDNVSPKVGIFALRDIQKGAECCYQYAPAGSIRSDTPCQCRRDKCSGFLPLGCFATT